MSFAAETLAKYACKHCYNALGDHSICTCAEHQTDDPAHAICAACAKQPAGRDAGIAAVNAAWLNPLHRTAIKRNMRVNGAAMWLAAPRGQA